MRLLLYLLADILFNLALATLLHSAEWNVSTTGTATGNGSITAPWDLVTGLTKTLVKPGDTLRIHAGTYIPIVTNNSRLQSTLAGISSSYITIQGVGRVVIDLKNFSGMEIQGGYTRWWDLEFTNTIQKTRITSQEGPWSAETDRGGVNINGPEVEMIDCVFHDFNNGPFSGHLAMGGLFYGCISYNHGWIGGDRPHGHLFYLQNTGAKPKICEMGIGWGAYDDGFNAYGSVDSVIKSIQFLDCIGSHNGRRNLHYGGETPIENGVISGNVFGIPTFMTADTIAVTGGAAYVGPSLSLLAENNYFVGAFRTSGQSVRQMTFRQNTVVGGRDDGAGPRFIDWLKTPTDVISWDQNTYYGSGSFLSNYTVKTFPQWQADGYDATSKVIPGNPPDRQFLKPHRYKPGKAHLAIINWSGAGSASVDLSSVVQAGKSFEIRSVYDPFGTPVASGTGTSVSIPLGTVVPPTPISATAPTATVDKRFQFFVVTSSGTTPPPVTTVAITSPADGTTLVVGQTVKATGTGTNLRWHVDLSGAANPPDTTGPETTFTIPTGTTKVVITLTGDGGQDVHSYPVTTEQPPSKKKKLALFRDTETGELYTSADDGVTFKPLVVR